MKNASPLDWNKSLRHCLVISQSVIGSSRYSRLRGNKEETRVSSREENDKVANNSSEEISYHRLLRVDVKRGVFRGDASVATKQLTVLKPRLNKQTGNSGGSMRRVTRRRFVTCSTD